MMKSLMNAVARFCVPDNRAAVVERLRGPGMKGIGFDQESEYVKEQREQAYMKMNEMGRTPVLKGGHYNAVLHPSAPYQ